MEYNSQEKKGTMLTNDTFLKCRSAFDSKPTLNFNQEGGKK